MKQTMSAAARIGTLLLVVFGVASLLFILTLLSLGLNERSRLSETDLQRHQRLAHNLVADCPLMRTAKIEPVLRACREGTSQCSDDFNRLIEVLAEVVQSSSDPGCARSLGLYASESFRLASYKLEPDSSEKKQLFRLGWSRFKELLSVFFPRKAPNVPTPKEIDDEFRRVQRAIGAPETGAPPWRNRTPPQEKPSQTFQSVGSSIEKK